MDNKVTKDSISQIEPTGVKSKKLSWRDLLKPIGASGTFLQWWLISEEYNTKLEWKTWLAIYDEMRKWDATVKATLKVCEMPIRATKWFVEGALNDDDEVDTKNEEVREFVSNALFDKMETSWDQFLIECLTSLPFWFSVFEKTFKIDDEWKIWIKKLWYRKQTSIWKWETELWAAGITQSLPQAIEIWTSKGYQMVSIPSSKLLVFTNDKEWDNYEGVSILRSAYKHWFYKDNFYKFDSIRQERLSVGIPVMYTPWALWDEDKANVEKIVSNIRTTSQTGIVMPWKKEDWWLFEFADTKSSGDTKIYESINHHNREISKNVLAQFLELWNTESWSRALDESQSSMFLNALEAIAKNIADVFNRYLIPELVDLNFDVVKYPKLKFDKLGAVDYTTLSNALATLSNGGIITPDEDLEWYIRTMMNLPAKIEWEELVKPETDVNTQKPKKTPKQPKNDVKTKDNWINKEELEKEWKKEEEWFTEDMYYNEISWLIDNKIILDLQKQAYSQEDNVELKKKWFQFNEYEKISPRPLTFAERKVNFTSLNRSMGTFESVLEEQIEDSIKEIKSDLVKQVKTAVKNNDIKAIWILKARHTWKLAGALTEVQKEMFEIGKKWAAIEMNVRVPRTNWEVRWAMRVQNGAVAEFIKTDIETGVKTNLTQAIQKKGWMITNLSVSEAVAIANEVITKKLLQAKSTLTSLWVTGAVNLWRATIFEKYPEQIYAMQYSAIIDTRTTELCMSLDWRVVKPWSSQYHDFTPPNHYGCRSIWVEILHEETFKPKIWWIPNSIPVSKTIDLHKKMSAPVLLKGSPAVKVLQTEIAERKTKLELLQTDNKYPNRQLEHKKRIKQLEKSIAGKYKELLINEWIKFND